jgi:hypothetical protein
MFCLELSHSLVEAKSSAGTRGPQALLTSEFLDGTSPRIYPWNQSKIEHRNPQAPAFIRGVNLKSKI